MNLTKLSIERPTLLVAIIILLLFFGLFSYSKLNYELVPQFTPPVLTVVTIYPGATAEEVESEVSIPVEDLLASIENIDLITTISKENFSLVRLELKTGTDVDFALQDAARKLQLISDKLPVGARKPVLSRFDFNDLPVMRIAYFSNLSPSEITGLSDEKIVPALKKLRGVADVRLLGDVRDEITVSLDRQKLALYHVTPLQILKAMGSANRNMPAGYIESDEHKTNLKFSGKFTSIYEIEQLVLYSNTEKNIKIRLRDVAVVTESTEPVKVITRLNGKPALGIDIKKQVDANAVDLSKLVVKELKLLENEFASNGLRFEIAADTSIFTVEAANAVMEDLLLAILLVSIVMLTFLHNIRIASIVLISIPISIISTFIIMELMCFSLNLLSLLGLSLAIGILVDDAIVILENISRHISSGKNSVKAAYEGRMEIGFTAISITLIDIVVFVPVIFASGMVADLLHQFAVVIVTSTLMSLFVSFTLVPMLASRWGKKLNPSGKPKLRDKIEAAIEAVALKMSDLAHWSLNHKLLIATITLILFTSSILLIPAGYIGIEFTKAGDRSEFLMEIELDKSATLSRTDKITKEVEKILMAYPEVEVVFTNTGITSSGRIESNNSFMAELYIKLIDKSKRTVSTAGFSEEVKQNLTNKFPGVIFRPIEINIIGLRDDDAVQVSLLSLKRDSLLTPAKEIYKLLESTDGSREIQTSSEKATKSFEFIPDIVSMDTLGVDPVQAAATLRTLISGNRDFSFAHSNKTIPINIIAAPEYRATIKDVARLTIINGQGKVIPFRLFGVFTETETQGTLERTNRMPSVTIKSQVVGRPAGTVSNDLKKKIETAGFASDINFLWGGSTKRTTEALVTLGIAFAISILLVYLVLVALYDSYFYPFAVLLSIPLALIGAFIALAISGQALSIFSIMGLIMMTGLVGKNAILIVDFANHLRIEGKDLTTSIAMAVQLRFRPVVMTTLTIVFGLLPVALSSGAGSEWKNGLGWVLIGGLTSSLFLNFIVIPVVYYSIEKFLMRFGWSDLTRKKIKVDDYK